MQFKNQNYGRKFGVSSFSLTSDLFNYPELLSGSPKGEHSKHPVGAEVQLLTPTYRGFKFPGRSEPLFRFFYLPRRKRKDSKGRWR